MDFFSSVVLCVGRVLLNGWRKLGLRFLRRFMCEVHMYSYIDKVMSYVVMSIAKIKMKAKIT